MELKKIKNLKKGWCINHPVHGFLQYRGLATIHPYTEDPKIPHQYIFWPPVDEDGNTQPDICETDGNLTVEVTDKISIDE